MSMKRSTKLTIAALPVAAAFAVVPMVANASERPVPPAVQQPASSVIGGSNWTDTQSQRVQANNAQGSIDLNTDGRVISGVFRGRGKPASVTVTVDGVELQAKILRQAADSISFQVAIPANLRSDDAPPFISKVVIRAANGTAIATFEFPRPPQPPR